jgi:serine/threonine protein kinase
MACEAFSIDEEDLKSYKNDKTTPPFLGLTFPVEAFGRVMLDVPMRHPLAILDLNPNPKVDPPREPLPQDDLQFILRLLLNAARHMHSRGIQHGDLNSTSVLAANVGTERNPIWRPRIIDWGKARFRETDDDFTPPKSKSCSSYVPMGRRQHDLWCVFIMGYELLTGKNAALEVNAEDSSRRMPTFPLFRDEWDEDTIFVFKWGFHPKHEIRVLSGVLLTWTWFGGKKSVPVPPPLPEEGETTDTDGDDNGRGEEKAISLVRHRLVGEVGPVDKVDLS